MQLLKEFSDKALKQIRWWAWAATVLPMTGLAGMFFLWVFGTKEWIDIFMTVGATLMFSVAVIWWWWVIWVVSRIVKRDRKIAEDLYNSTKTIKDLKIIIRENFSNLDK